MVGELLVRDLVVRDLVDVVDWAVIVVAVVRMVRVDRTRLARGRWSKAGWILAAGLIVWNVGPLAVPLGALEALARTRRAHRPGAAGPADVAAGGTWEPR